MSLPPKKKDKVFEEKKKPGKYEDPRFTGKTVNKVRQQQRREYVLSTMIKRAKGKKSMGMDLFPEEEWVLNNKKLFL